MKYPQLVSMPSEITDWLEEQLEARGIDAVVYTRYILSLLHRDSVDVVCPDQDLHFIQPHKEVRRSGSGRKHFCCLTGWRDHLQADAEKLKRIAVIECLMSASDQDCGIETLVDELCEKLKEANNKAPVNTDLANTSSHLHPQVVSPQDLIQKYYAAFPPLSKHRTTGTPANIVTLMPKWFSSPKKKAARRQNRSASFEEKLHYRVETDIMKPRLSGKQRFGYFSRSRNDFGYSHSMAKSVERSESMTDWDSLVFSNSISSTFLDNNSKEFTNIVEEKVDSNEKQNRMLWSNEESMNICEDLPVDIMDLLDSPAPQGYTVEMMNLANMREVGNKNFIQCGTNITSSIWSADAVMDDSAFDNTYNTAVDADESETLDMKFRSLTVGNSIESIWSNPMIVQNETNTFYESCRTSSLLYENAAFYSLDSWEYSSGLEKFEKWSEAEYFDNEGNVSALNKSLIKLNHNKEESAFIEVVPKLGIQLYNKFSNTLPMLNYSDNIQHSGSAEKEDLLTSVRSHFQPINDIQNVKDGKSQLQYADGTSFVISGKLENPNYICSSSGSQYLVSEKGSPKKVKDYKIKNGKLSKSAFTLKFVVKQNDTASQTDDSIMDCELDSSEVPCKKCEVNESKEEFFFPGDEDEANLFMGSSSENIYKSCKADSIFTFSDKVITCQVHVVRPDSVLAEMWKDNSRKCDRCNKNTFSWDNTHFPESVGHVEKEALESIWNGGEVCHTCINLNGVPLPHNSQLREDISQDGEQLLSDLSTLQKSYYMELPTAEISYDISELLTGNKEQKRCRSPIYEKTSNAFPVHRGSWNISSLMQVATVPVLHSVTL